MVMRNPIGLNGRSSFGLHVKQAAWKQAAWWSKWFEEFFEWAFSLEVKSLFEAHLAGRADRLPENHRRRLLEMANNVAHIRAISLWL